MTMVEPPIDKDFDKSSGSSKDLRVQQKKSTIYEIPGLIHDGISCRKQGCNVCSPPSVVNELEEKRKRYFLLAHKGRNARARIKTIAKLQTRDDWDPSIDLEDLGN